MKLFFSANAKNLCNPDGKGNETKCSMKCIDKDYDNRLVFLVSKIVKSRHLKFKKSPLVA